MAMNSLIFTPSVEVIGEESSLPDTPHRLMERGQFAQVPVILGCTVKEGIVFAFTGINESVFEKINNKREFLVPSFLGLKPGSIEEKEAANEIWDFYLQGNPLSWNNVNDLLLCYSDIEFSFGMEQSRSYLVDKSSAPVYTYLFTNHTRCLCKSMVHMFSENSSEILNADWTVFSHAHLMCSEGEMKTFSYFLEEVSTNFPLRVVQSVKVVCQNSSPAHHIQEAGWVVEWIQSIFEDIPHPEFVTPLQSVVPASSLVLMDIPTLKQLTFESTVQGDIENIEAGTAAPQSQAVSQMWMYQAKICRFQYIQRTKFCKIAQDKNARGNLGANLFNVIVPCQSSVKVHSKELNGFSFIKKNIVHHHCRPSCTIRATSASPTGKRTIDETGPVNGSSRELSKINELSGSATVEKNVLNSLATLKGSSIVSFIVFSVGTFGYLPLASSGILKNLKAKNSITETCHGADYWFLYNYTLIPTPDLTPVDIEAIKKHVKAWTSFAYSGDPNHEDLGVTWERDSKTSPCYMDIGASWELKEGFALSDRISFWNKLWKKYTTI
ncbi:hypothetical protein J6590_071809 [Homalodisca vitripennis]|nr:hypothetical protein J6590_071809 [Homalodisca vitripennis]